MNSRSIILILFCALCASMAPAQTAKTRTDLYTEIDALFPDNTDGLITPSRLRFWAKNSVASAQNGLTDGTALTTTAAASTYLTQSNAASTYLTQANAASTYLTPANAASTYQPLITTGGIGATQLASTAVTPGTYTLATVTVDSDGRITFASNGSAGSGSGDMLGSNNLSEITNAATARSNLGLVIGTNVQAYSAQLSGIVSVIDETGYWYCSGGTWVISNAIPQSDITGLATALSGKQTSDTDLTSWAGITRASGFDTFTATPSAANFAALVTGETGTGAPVFGTNPALVSPTYTVAAVAASAIDWAAGDTHTKTLSANTTFTFSNATAGKQIVVAVTNTASNYTVTWPTVSWSGGTAPTQTTGAKTDIYTFIQIGSTIYGSAIQNF